MADVLLFHHAQGLTPGVLAFAERLRDQGHVVTTPDLYGGRVFDDLSAGVSFAEGIGMERVIEAGAAVAEELPHEIVYAGFSLGALPAQYLAQTRAGALAALLYHAGEPSEALGCPWPPAVPLQVHVTEGDEWVELVDLRGLVAEALDGELFVYPGSAHLFTDESLDEYEAGAAALVIDRTLSLLDRLG